MTVLVRNTADGALAERDRSYLSRRVVANTRLDRSDAQKRVDAVAAQIDEARSHKTEAAEQARIKVMKVLTTAAP